MARGSNITLPLRWLAGASLLLGAACDSPRPPTGVGGEAAVPLRITAVTVGTPISTLIVEVSAADLPNTLVFNLTVVNGVASGTIKIPPGPARTIHVSAVDDQGNVTHDGSVTIDVHPGQNPPVEVKLRPRSGQIPITVTFGNYTVLVTPEQATIDATVNSQLQLTVRAIDVDGQEIGSPSVGWATGQPAIATVDQNGLVTGVASGTATIVATYEGVAGLSLVTVTAPGGPPPDPFTGTWMLDPPQPEVVCQTTPAVVTIDWVISRVTTQTSSVDKAHLIVLPTLGGFLTTDLPEFSIAFDPNTGAFNGSGTLHESLADPLSTGFMDVSIDIDGAFLNSDSFSVAVSWSVSGEVQTAGGTFDFTCPQTVTHTTGTRS